MSNKRLAEMCHAAEPRGRPRARCTHPGARPCGPGKRRTDYMQSGGLWLCVPCYHKVPHCDGCDEYMRSWYSLGNERVCHTCFTGEDVPTEATQDTGFNPGDIPFQERDMCKGKGEDERSRQSSVKLTSEV